jgi:hypothetical protein
VRGGGGGTQSNQLNPFQPTPAHSNPPKPTRTYLGAMLCWNESKPGNLDSTTARKFSQNVNRPYYWPGLRGGGGGGRGGVRMVKDTSNGSGGWDVKNACARGCLCNVKGEVRKAPSVCPHV